MSFGLFKVGVEALVKTHECSKGGEDMSERVEEIRERRGVALRHIAEFPWKDWDARRVKELLDEQGYLLAQLAEAQQELGEWMTGLTTQEMLTEQKVAAARAEGFRAGLEEGARIADSVPEPVKGVVDTGAIWRKASANAIAAAIRRRAQEGL